MTLLIVNADDFGLTLATSQAIIECHERGIVTSTSLLTLGAGFAQSEHLLTRHPTLGCGVHLALVGEDPPLRPPSDIPTLVDERGGLARSWREFLRRAATGRIDPADIERELSSQVDRALSTGARLTHVDAHQHLHQWPPMWDIVRRMAERAGVRAVRTTRSPGVDPVGLLGRLAARRAARSGLSTTDRFVGFRQSGHLTEPALEELLRSLPSKGSVELGCHPGAETDPDRARYAWGFEWHAESSALRSAAARSIVEARGIRLGTFADLDP